MMIRIFLLTVVTLSVLLSYQCNSPSNDQDGRQLAMNFCISDSSYLQPCTDCQSAKQRYFANYWIDTTSQFYVKSLIFNEGKDTIYVTVTDGLEEKELTRAIHNQTDTTFNSEWYNNGTYRQFNLIGRHAGNYLIRSFFIDNSFDDIMVMDLPIGDSIRAYHYFRNKTINQQITLCL